MLLDRPKRALAVLLSVLLLSVSLVLAPRDTSTQQERDPSYVITLRHYGIDGREMERTVAIPLEDALSAIPGVTHVLTTSEQGKVRCFVRFSGLSAGSYEAVRDAAQRVYETLPPSAQRPELSSSRDSRVPVWSAAVFLKTDLAVSSRAGSAMARADAPRSNLASPSGPGSAMARADAPSLDLAASSRAGSAIASPGQSLGSILERIVKPAFERLDGAGEVELAGTGLPELVIYLDERACAARGIEAWQVARQLSEQDLLLPGGSITEADRDIMLTIDGRYKTAQDIYEAPILLPGGQMVPLSTLGRIVEQDRKPEAIARLDGQAAAVISIMGSSSIPIAQLSRSIQQTVKELGRLPLEFYVLSDRGAEETAAFRSVLSATLQGSLIVAVAVALLAGASSLMGILSVPLIMLFSAAALKLAGFSLDRLSLAGLACGVGAAVDSTILVVERLHRTKDGSQKAAALGALAPSLIASVSTTIVALIPLALLGASSGIVTSIAWGIGTSSAVALVYALFLLPAFVGGSQSGYARYKRKAHTGLNNRYGRYWSSPVHLLHRLKRRALRLFGAVLMGSYQRPLLILLMGLALSLGGMGALFFSGADVASLPSEDSVYAQIEF
ncbi:MAG TPA: efflux RND transporter permease subunit, partial [Treponema sp.]|nr:efflux RND transporter permease subunit [Treponema sp.]